MEEQNTTSTPTLVPANNDKAKVLGLILVIVLLIIGSGFLVFQNMQLQKEIDSLKTGDKTLMTTATPDPTASWTQVTMKNWNFKIPPTLDWFSCNGREDLAVVDLAQAMSKISVNNHLSECNFDYVGLISIAQVSSPYTIPTTPPVLPTADPNNPEGSGFYTVVSDTKNINIGGKNATYQKEVQNGGQGAGTYYKAYVVDGTKTYIFSLTDAYQKDLFDQILSTFRFTQ